MKAMLVGENKKLLWTEVAEPTMGENDVLVEIHAVALNRADILQKNGSYPSPKGWPEGMGLELAGVITDMGVGAKANSTYQIGDKVCALVGGGGYAERIAVPYELLMPVPKGWSFEEASAIPEAFEKLEKEGRPVNVCMDCLSGEDLGKAMPYMARGGYWVVISTLAGVETNVKLRPLLTKGLHLVGSMLRNRTNEEKAFILQSLVKELFPHMESGAIKPSIYKVLPMEQAEEAHGILERFENTGKVVLKVK